MMTSRNACLLVLVQVLLASTSSESALGGENNPGKWDKNSAAQYLDSRGEAWFNFGSAHRGQKESTTTCVSCHSLLPYALARPALRRISDDSPPTKLETKILEQTKSRVANWDRLDAAEFQLMYDFDDDKKKQSRGTEAVLNALILSLDDRFQGRKEPSDAAKKALSILWANQIVQGPKKGRWEWLNFGMEPWESNVSPYMGACLAAVAVGAVPGEVLTGADGDSPQRLRLTARLSDQEFRRPEPAQPGLDALGVFELGRVADTRAKGGARRANPRQAAGQRWLDLGLAR